MIVRLSATEPATLADLDRLDRLHAELDGPLDAARWPAWCHPDDDGAHVWLDIASCRELGRDECGDEWAGQFDAMIAYATSKGWTNADATEVRAHIAPADLVPDPSPDDTTGA